MRWSRGATVDPSHGELQCVLLRVGVERRALCINEGQAVVEWYVCVSLENMVE